MTLRPFRFGIINEGIPSPREWRERARRAESLGYATFLLRDHFVSDFFGAQLAPMAALAVAASVTTSLRIGTLVFANDFRHPVVLAKEVATLDLLSAGRFELGLGAGWLQTEYARAGFPFDPPGVRIDRLQESVQVLKGLFADDPLSFAGQHYVISNLVGSPQPAQRPRPPLLIGGGGKRILRLAGHEADIVGILTTSVTTGSLVVDPFERLTEKVAQKVSWVREGAGERFSTIELNLVPDLIITDHRQRETERYIERQGWSGLDAHHVWDMPAVFIGSVDQIAEDMHRRREHLGFSYFVLSNSDMESASPIVARLAGG